MLDKLAYVRSLSYVRSILTFVIITIVAVEVLVGLILYLTKSKQKCEKYKKYFPYYQWIDIKDEVISPVLQYAIMCWIICQSFMVLLG